MVSKIIAAYKKCPHFHRSLLSHSRLYQGILQKQIDVYAEILSLYPDLDPQLERLIMSYHAELDQMSLHYFVHGWHMENKDGGP